MFGNFNSVTRGDLCRSFRAVVLIQIGEVYFNNVLLLGCFINELILPPLGAAILGLKIFNSFLSNMPPFGKNYIGLFDMCY